MPKKPAPQPSKIDQSIGPCILCGKKTWWWNNVPLKAFCWGSEGARHHEVSIYPPPEHQPYWKGMTRKEKKEYRELAGRFYWNGFLIRTEEELRKIDFPFPPEPDL